MHLGNIATALVSWVSARSQGGSWIVRIEDLDRGRSRRNFADLIFDDLDWLGLSWDEEPLWQSERDEVYMQYFDRLSTYPCYCSRADLMAASAPHSEDGHHIYPGTCRPVDGKTPELALSHCEMGRKPAWRVNVPEMEIEFTDKAYGYQKADLRKEWGDFVVRRANGEFAYQLAVVVDDALSGVTEVVRGVDLLSSTAPQLFLYDALGLQNPAFGHIPLICNSEGQRLSKRDNSLSMEEMRKTMRPEHIFGKIAYAYGFIPHDDAISLSQLVERFSWDVLSDMRKKIANFVP